MSITDIGKITYSVHCTPIEEQELTADSGTYARAIHSVVGTSFGGGSTITTTDATADSFLFDLSATVTTGGTQLDADNESPVKFMVIQNTDDTNFIQVSLDGGGSYPIKISPKSAFVLEGPGTLNYHLLIEEVTVKANTADVVVKWMFGV